jgi:hypothetical protein
MSLTSAAWVDVSASSVCARIGGPEIEGAVSMSEQDLFNEDDEPVEDRPPAELPTDAPEADAVEQSRPLAERHEPIETVGERPEADALEQDRIEDDEDDDRR